MPGDPPENKDDLKLERRLSAAMTIGFFLMVGVFVAAYFTISG